MIALDVLTTAIPAAARSGLLKPVGPQSLYRLARTGRTRGANPSILLHLAAERWPRRTAIIDDFGALTYHELLSRTATMERILYRRHGIRPGQAVGIMCRNGAGFVVAALAVAGIGADVVLLNTDFNPPALAAALASHRIPLVVCDEEFAAKVTAADSAVAILDAADFADAPTEPAPGAGPGKIVLLTSGTTGSPKGVARVPGPSQVLGVAASIIDRTRLRTGSRVAIAVPFFHAFGFTMLTLTLTLGGTILTRRRFDAEHALAQASLHRADALAVVPIMLKRLLDLPEPVRARNPVPALRLVISGGSALEPALGQQFMDAYGDILCNGYGSTEVGLGSFAIPTDLRRSPATVGRPLAGSPVLILDDHDRPVPAETIGRIFVGGSLTFDGYTEGTRKPVVANTTATGDLGYLDRHGCLHVVGREDDMIVSGGENVYPQAVQNILATHPDIIDSAVIGVPDDDYGQRLAVFLVLRPGATFDEAATRDFLKHTVSRFEQPRDIHVVAEIPRNPTGKILRHQLTA
ncbi:AMP-binding protein [Nocardia otitidiscaviarum]|uniref:AMP-binding protein n=1 Tax=Nocardia otitidiscaviarum TaxID=1823 RepID=UPI0004A7088D|nr:AMP-binding protein [Nocardia otitidiscaviarum]MBF6135035.1 AMP-binding protein [Nocardia otitidiscaviarum]MBF6486858.1 AMP-binding protein [Nocardia otitidiscaviarum]